MSRHDQEWLAEDARRSFQQQADSLDEARNIAYVGEHLERLIHREATSVGASGSQNA